MQCTLVTGLDNKHHCSTGEQLIIAVEPDKHSVYKRHALLRRHKQVPTSRLLSDR